MKDWHLLLLAIGIIMIDVLCVGPLLILNYVYGDTWYEPDYENPPSINASDSLYTFTLASQIHWNVSTHTVL